MKKLIFFILIIIFTLTESSYSQWIRYRTGFDGNTDIQFFNLSTGWAIGFPNTILKTTNAGENWFNQNKNVSTPVSHCYFINPDTGWIVGSYGTIIKTTNGGDNWISKSFDDAFRYSVFFPTPDTGWSVGIPGIITKTTDGGETWVNQPNPANWYLNDLFFINSMTGWVVGQQLDPYWTGVILKTTNGGENWIPQTSGTALGLHSVFFINSMIGWAGGSGAKILRTTDGGESWLGQTVGNPGGDHHMSIFFSDQLHGWAVGQHSCMYRSTDGGISWECEPNGINGIMYSVNLISGDEGWAVGSDWDLGGVLYKLKKAPSLTSKLTFVGESSLNYFGASATSAGDVNADGYNDFIIGAPDFNGRHGRSYLYYGGYNPDSIPDVIFNGETSWYPFFGHSSASAGDVNGDGYDDIIIGAYGWAGVNGRAYIFLGGSNMDSVPDIVIEGEQLFNDLGMCVASAGDINEDGYDDVIVNARGYNNWTGRAYVYFGGSNMDNIPDIIFTGENTDDQFSSTVANAGDVNGDHKPDLIITAFRYSNSTGRAYIYFGGAGMDNSADVIITGENVNDQFGSNAATAGDINKDGYSDIIIQASEFNNSTGRTYIYYGGYVMDNIPDLILNGEDPGNNFGSVTLNQDINGDGYSDLEIGAPGFNNNTGRVYVYFGGANMDMIPDYIMDGENSGDLFGVRASAAGDINSDGYNEFIVSAFGYNNSMGKAYLYYGSGDPLSECIIAGPQLLITGSMSAVYRSTNPAGYWSLSNYGNTQAAIVSENSHDTVLIDAGNIPGHFALYFSDNSNLLCTKHVYVDNPTPVELSEFIYIVNGSDVTLSWTTSAELNNSGFEIERSIVNGQISNEWNKIGFVSGNGTSTEIHNYEFIEKGLNTGKYNYRLKQIDFNGNYEYFELAEEVSIGIPDKYQLSQNYPNPFNPVTNIEFAIPELGFVSLRIYDVMGRELVTLVNENKEPGYYKLKFDAGKLSSGVYFYRMTAGDFVAVKKLVVLK